MGSLKLSNSASSTLAGSITSSDTLVSVATGDGAKFPSLGAGDWHPLTIVDASGGYEIMKVTARTGDVLTVTRAQEGTAAASFASGSRVDLRMTMAAFESLIPDGTAMLGGNNLSDVSSVIASRANLGLGDIATHSVSEFATAAQGTEADTAMQPAAGQSKNAAKVASTGAYGDLSGTPDLTVYATKANNLSDLASAATARTNLGLTSAATTAMGTGANQIVQLNGSAQLPAVSGALLTNLPVNAPSSGAIGAYAVGTGSTVGGTQPGSNFGYSGTWTCVARTQQQPDGSGGYGVDVCLFQRTS